MNKGRKKFFTLLVLGLGALAVLGATTTVTVVKNNQEKKSNSLVKISQQKQNNLIKKPKEQPVINSQQVNNLSLPKPVDLPEKPVNLPKPVPLVDQKQINREEPKKPKEQKPLNYSPSSPKSGKKVVEIKNGKAQVPREWLDTLDQITINELIFKAEYGSDNYDSRNWNNFYFEHITKKGISIQPPGTWWGTFKDSKEVKDLKELEKQIDEPAKLNEESEIIFNFVNVGSFHFSLLVYKKDDNCWRHYDSLGSCNFDKVKARTINNENLQNVPCPQQIGDGWGSCGTYPPIIFSILLKRYNNNQLNNPDDWKISDEEFRTERAKFMDII